MNVASLSHMVSKQTQSLQSRMDVFPKDKTWKVREISGPSFLGLSCHQTVGIYLSWESGRFHSICTSENTFAVFAREEVGARIRVKKACVLVDPLGGFSFACRQETWSACSLFVDGILQSFVLSLVEKKGLFVLFFFLVSDEKTLPG